MTASGIPSRWVSFLQGWRTAHLSLLTVPQVCMHMGIGALAHDASMSAAWTALASALMLAPPAQLIVLSGLTNGAPPVEVALAVTLTAIRLTPMAATLVPLLTPSGANAGRAMFVIHCTMVATWIEGTRRLPGLPPERRLSFGNGLAFGFLLTGTAAAVIGYRLAAALPPAIAAALVFVVPMAFLVMVAQGAKHRADQLAVALGLGVVTALWIADARLDALWGGVAAGSAGYILHRLRGRLSWQF